MEPPAGGGDAQPAQPWIGLGRMVLATLLHGIGSGLIGIFVALLISNVQILGFGKSQGDFLVIAMHAPPWRRMLCVTFAGVFGASAWYWLRGRDPGFVPVDVSLKEGVAMPPSTTVLNALIQDIVVALGGSFGREAAPREIAAMWGGWLADTFGVSPKQRRVLVACGTGAGLSAVYSVPISGTLYTIEHMLKWDLSPGAVLPAIVTSTLAALISSVVVPIDGLYDVPRFSYTWPSRSLMLWGVLIGPLAGAAAACFCHVIAEVRKHRPFGRVPVSFAEAREAQTVRLLWGGGDGQITVVKKVEVRRVERHWGEGGGPVSKVLVSTLDGAEEHREFEEDDWNESSPVGKRDRKIFVMMPAAFLLLAFLSLRFPSLLGNGRALAEVAIARQRHLGVLATLFFLKTFVTAAAIASGVDGGTLTPSVALGATLGAVLGAGCPDSWPGGRPPDEATSVITAAAFLASATKSPLTGLWLVVEFTAQGVGRHAFLAAFCGDLTPLMRSRLGMGMLIPMGTAVMGATLIFDRLMRTPKAAAEVLPGEIVTTPSGSAHTSGHSGHLMVSPEGGGSGRGWGGSERGIAETPGHSPAPVAPVSCASSGAFSGGEGQPPTLPRPISGTSALSAGVGASGSSTAFWGSERSQRGIDPTMQILVRMNSLNLGSDLDLQPSYRNLGVLLGPDSDKDAIGDCFTCFRTGLMLNTFVTVLFATSEPEGHQCAVTTAAVCGIAFSATLGVLLWGHGHYCRPHEDDDARRASRRTHHRIPTTEAASEAPVPEPRCPTTMKCWHGALCAGSGAMVPVMPYALRIYHDYGAETSLACGVACVVVAIASDYALDLAPRAGKAGAALRVFLYALLIVVAGGSGIFLKDVEVWRGVHRALAAAWCMPW